MFERRSALASAMGTRRVAGVDGAVGVRLGEARGFSLFEVAALPATVAAVEDRLVGMGRLSLPPSAARPTTTGDIVLFRLGPEKLWLMAPAGKGLGDELAAAIPAHEGVVIDLSSSRTRIVLDGVAAVAVLKKGIAIDLGEQEFPPGAAAMTGLHHVPILVHRTGRERFELLAPRTFALTIFEWVEDAALEFGYEITSSSNSRGNP